MCIRQIYSYDYIGYTSTNKHKDCSVSEGRGNGPIELSFPAFLKQALISTAFINLPFACDWGMQSNS